MDDDGHLRLGGVLPVLVLQLGPDGEHIFADGGQMRSAFPTLIEHRSINDAQYRIIEAFQMVFCFYFVILQPIYKDES